MGSRTIRCQPTSVSGGPLPGRGPMARLATRLRLAALLHPTFPRPLFAPRLPGAGRVAPVTQNASAAAAAAAAA
eukprot:CAMPEP_0115210494 /NCGR_PEP_ID=MMETSP0270-20121206/22277_1 /TAXON_ID=71861 /ORGANISM="Scrippsiella trochoidea, Strain CCMP3099" /LENGTH=73 /DNA_ID=CAMNT_0002624153 /DNA_START=489 /DNA_END=707 /DNA_ORIENTATION=+